MSDDSTIHFLTGAYALDALTERERQEFTLHLEDCEPCRIEAAEFLETAARAAVITEDPPPAHLRAAVLRRIAQERQLRTAQPSQHAPVVDLRERARPSRRRLIAVSAGVLAAAAAVAVGVVLSQDGLDASDVRLAADARSFRAEVGEDGQAVLVVSPSQDAALLTLAGLADPPDGSAYQLWLVDEAGPRPVEAQFGPEEDGTATALIDEAPDIAEVVVALTVEADPDPTAPSTPILLQVPAPRS